MDRRSFLKFAAAAPAARFVPFGALASAAAARPIITFQGFWLGPSAGTYKFAVGDLAYDKSKGLMVWDGERLVITGVVA